MADETPARTAGEPMLVRVGAAQADNWEQLQNEMKRSDAGLAGNAPVNPAATLDRDKMDVDRARMVFLSSPLGRQQQQADLASIEADTALRAAKKAGNSPEAIAAAQETLDRLNKTKSELAKEALNDPQYQQYLAAQKKLADAEAKVPTTMAANPPSADEIREAQQFADITATNQNRVNAVSGEELVTLESYKQAKQAVLAEREARQAVTEAENSYKRAKEYAVRENSQPAIDPRIEEGLRAEVEQKKQELERATAELEGSGSPAIAAKSTELTRAQAELAEIDKQLADKTAAAEAAKKTEVAAGGLVASTAGNAKDTNTAANDASDSAKKSANAAEKEAQSERRAAAAAKVAALEGELKALKGPDNEQKMAARDKAAQALIKAEMDLKNRPKPLDNGGEERFQEARKNVAKANEKLAEAQRALAAAKQGLQDDIISRSRERTREQAPAQSAAPALVAVVKPIAAEEPVRASVKPIAQPVVEEPKESSAAPKTVTALKQPQQPAEQGFLAGLINAVVSMFTGGSEQGQKSGASQSGATTETRVTGNFIDGVTVTKTVKQISDLSSAVLASVAQTGAAMKEAGATTQVAANYNQNDVQVAAGAGVQLDPGVVRL